MQAVGGALCQRVDDLRLPVRGGKLKIVEYERERLFHAQLRKDLRGACGVAAVDKAQRLHTADKAVVQRRELPHEPVKARVWQIFHACVPRHGVLISQREADRRCFAVSGGRFHDRQAAAPHLRELFEKPLRKNRLFRIAHLLHRPVHSYLYFIGTSAETQAANRVGFAVYIVRCYKIATRFLCNITTDGEILQNF